MEINSAPINSSQLNSHNLHDIVRSGDLPPKGESTPIRILTVN